MNATKPTLPLRTRLGVGLAVAALALMAGCGNDLSQAGDTTTTSSQPTRTTEATGGDSTTTTSSTSSTTTEPSGGVDGSVASSTSAPTGMTIPTGITLPDGTELTLPEGVDLTIPDGLGGCVDAGAALTRLSLGALGVSSIDNIDQDVTTLKKAFGPASTKDIAGRCWSVLMEKPKVARSTRVPPPTRRTPTPWTTSPHASRRCAASADTPRRPALGEAQPAGG